MTFRTRCLTCDSGELTAILDLGMHPMADSFIPPASASTADRTYPLVCDLCSTCGQIQLRTITDPEARYVDTDYSYTSSNSATSRGHWTEYARHVSAQAKTPAGSWVVEIGSNDGFLSHELQTLGFQVRGVDPSPVMALAAKERGVTTTVALFSEATATRLAGELSTRPALIVANNVFNHANEPRDFVRGIRKLLAPEGTFVFELPYWLRSIEQGKFDQIYHEHVTYFTVRYAEELFRREEMHVTAVEEVDYHGGSIRVYVRHGAAPSGASARPFIKAEADAGLFDAATYRRFATEMVGRRDRFLRRIYELRAAGKRIVCVGAAAKGNTFLNYYNLSASVVDYVTDASPTKQGKFTPHTRIPIVGDDVFSKYGEVYAILLSWNISGPLQKALSAINPGITFLDPYAADA